VHASQRLFLNANFASEAATTNSGINQQTLLRRLTKILMKQLSRVTLKTPNLQILLNIVRKGGREFPPSAIITSCIIFTHFDKLQRAL